MKTAALLPTPGDPLLARYWLRNYELWQGEVDELMVFVNGEPQTAQIYEAAGARVITGASRVGHGHALDLLLSATDADRVVFVEDDAFVRRPGVIRERLENLEPNKVTGCPRGGMSPELHVEAAKKWGEVTGPDGSTGHGLWPCFLFAHTKDLRKCGSFASRSWGPGETIPGLGYTCPTELQTDTMTAAAFVLRDTCKILPDVQYKELWQKECQGDEPWFHAGGLSNDIASGRPDIGMDNLEGKDWAHRLWWQCRIGHDVVEHARRMQVDPDWWTDKLLPWITWSDLG